MARGVRPVNPEMLLNPCVEPEVTVNRPISWMAEGFLYWPRWVLILALTALGACCLYSTNEAFFRGLVATGLCMLGIRCTGRAESFTKGWLLIVAVLAGLGAYLLVL